MSIKPQSYVPKNEIATAKNKANAFLPRNMPRTWRQFALVHLMAKGFPEGKANAMLDKGPIKKTPTIAAQIDGLRWICKCECGGAEVVDPGEPLFFCLSCLNKETANGRLRNVVFPKNIERSEQIVLKENRKVKHGI